MQAEEKKIIVIRKGTGMDLAKEAGVCYRTVYGALRYEKNTAAAAKVRELAMKYPYNPNLEAYDKQPRKRR